jgi:succinyl-diaminopimelate desuccinylase
MTEQDSDLETLTSNLVQIETENPPGNERKCAEFICDWFTEQGVDAKLVYDPFEDRPQVVATVGTERPRVVLNGHMDVVPVEDPEAWSVEPYGGRVNGNRLYGRGSTDMKGPLACGMLALTALASEIRDGSLSGSLLFQAAVGEETGEPGTKRLLELGYDGEYGIVLEPTGLRTATSQKGVAWYSISINGTAGHASRPDNSANPIGRVNSVLDSLNSYDKRLSERVDPLVGRSQITPTVLAAGQKINVIPHRATVSVDRRFLPSESIEQLDEEIDQLTRSVDSDERFDVTWERVRALDSSSIPTDSRLATVFRHHSAAVADVSPEPWGDDAASDVRNFINDADMEAITWGPSDTDLAHRVDEYIDLPETKQALTILKSALRELLDTQ